MTATRRAKGGADGGRSTHARPVGVAWLQAARLVIGDYVALTKPRVISLLLVTTVATMFVADRSPAPQHRSC